jgi:hypothetical protein
MLLTPHTLIGIAIASSVPELGVAVPLSFGMHFLGDLVPHWDFYTNTTKEQKVSGWRPMAVMADLALGVAVGMYFTLRALWVLQNPHLAITTFLCGIASVLPDALTGPSLYLKQTNFFLKGIQKLQRNLQFPASLPWGLISQVVIAVFCLLMISNSLGQ